jgi:ubiquitin-conjugating enzyme E2 O
LDGTVEVTHPDWTVETYDLRRLTRLYDGIEQLEDDQWDAGSEGYHSYDDDDDSEQQWAMDQDGVWRPAQPSEEWEDVSSTHDDHDDDMHVDEQEIMEVDHALWESEDTEPEVHLIRPEINQDEMGVEETGSATEPSQLTIASTTLGFEENDFSDSVQWSRFEILSSAPVDHAFYSSSPAQPSKAFLGRLNKEYRALKSSLPGRLLLLVDTILFLIAV